MTVLDGTDRRLTVLCSHDQFVCGTAKEFVHGTIVSVPIYLVVIVRIMCHNQLMSPIGFQIRASTE